MKSSRMGKKKVLKKNSLDRESDTKRINIVDDESDVNNCDEDDNVQSKRLSSEVQLMDRSSTSLEKLRTNIAKVSVEKDMLLAKNTSPELNNIFSDLHERITELKTRVAPLMEIFAELPGVDDINDDTVDYLVVKQQLLLSYCVNLLFYLNLKVNGESTKDHPVMIQLLELRYVMEKLRPLDGKLQHQVDRLMRLSSLKISQNEKGESAAKIRAAVLRPNPGALLSKDDSDGDEDGSEHDKDDSDSDIEDDLDDNKLNSREDVKSQLYRPPKMTSMPYEENETDSIKREKLIRSKQKKLKKSELMETLREEFGHAPEASSSTGMARAGSADQKLLDQEAEERRKFEEDRFVRLTMSRKDKKDIKRRTAAAQRLDNFADIADVGDFEELSDLANKMSRRDASSATSSSSSKLDKKSMENKSRITSAAALQKAVAAFSQQSDVTKAAPSSKVSSSTRNFDFDSDGDDGVSSNSSKNKRKREEKAQDKSRNSKSLDEFIKSKKSPSIKQRERDDW